MVKGARLFHIALHLQVDGEAGVDLGGIRIRGESALEVGSGFGEAAEIVESAAHFQKQPRVLREKLQPVCEGFGGFGVLLEAGVAVSLIEAEVVAGFAEVVVQVGIFFLRAQSEQRAVFGAEVLLVAQGEAGALDGVFAADARDGEREEHEPEDGRGESQPEGERLGRSGGGAARHGASGIGEDAEDEGGEQGVRGDVQAEVAGGVNEHRSDRPEGADAEGEFARTFRFGGLGPLADDADERGDANDEMRPDEERGQPRANVAVFGQQFEILGVRVLRLALHRRRAELSRVVEEAAGVRAHERMRAMDLPREAAEHGADVRLLDGRRRLGAESLFAFEEIRGADGEQRDAGGGDGHGEDHALGIQHAHRPDADGGDDGDGEDRADIALRTTRDGDADKAHGDTVDGEQVGAEARVRPAEDGQRECAEHFEQGGEVMGRDVEAAGPGVILLGPDDPRQQHVIVAGAELPRAHRDMEKRVAEQRGEDGEALLRCGEMGDREQVDEQRGEDEEEVGSREIFDGDRAAADGEIRGECDRGAEAPERRWAGVPRWRGAQHRESGDGEQRVTRQRIDEPGPADESLQHREADADEDKGEILHRRRGGGSVPEPGRSARSAGAWREARWREGIGQSPACGNHSSRAAMVGGGAAATHRERRRRGGPCRWRASSSPHQGRWLRPRLRCVR